jgi:hypothetical protein
LTLSGNAITHHLLKRDNSYSFFSLVPEFCYMLVLFKCWLWISNVI